MNKSNTGKRMFNSLIILINIYTLIMILLLSAVIVRQHMFERKMQSVLTEDEILRYNIAKVENNQIDKLLKSIESFSKNKKVKDYKQERETKLNDFFFTDKYFIPYFLNREKKESKITFCYLTEKEGDSLEKDDIIKSFKGKWVLNTLKYEKDIYKEITLKDKIDKYYSIKFDLVDKDIFVIKNYIFKKVTLETYNTFVDEILIKNENIDSYIEKYNFDKIKKEINVRYNENKDFINKINERLKER